MNVVTEGRKERRLDKNINRRIDKKPVCILRSADTHGKGMNPTILPPAMGTYSRRDRAF